MCVFTNRALRQSLLAALLDGNCLLIIAELLQGGLKRRRYKTQKITTLIEKVCLKPSALFLKIEMSKNVPLIVPAEPASLVQNWQYNSSMNSKLKEYCSVCLE